MKGFLGAISLAAATIIATAASASPAVTLTSDGEYYLGAPYTLGFSFTVATADSITALGVFAANDGGSNGAADVGLWDSTGTLLAFASVPAGGVATLDGTFRYASITPYALTPGVTYVVGAYDPTDYATSFGNGQGGSAIVDPNVTILQDQYSPSNYAFSFPEASGGDVGGAWLGANFELGASSVPEPASWAMMLAGFGGLGLLLRARRRPSTAEA